MANAQPNPQPEPLDVQKCNKLFRDFCNKRAPKEERDAAFNEFYSLMGPHVEKIIDCRVWDKGVIDDLVQSVFMVVVHKHEQFDQQRNVIGWVVAITQNRVNDYFRKLGRQRRVQSPDVGLNVVDERAPDPAEVAAEIEDAEEFCAALSAALGQLPDRQRQAFTLLHFSGFSYEQIAEEMNIRVNSVGSLLARAKKRLKTNLGDFSRSELIFRFLFVTCAGLRLSPRSVAVKLADN